jgi:predicted methyltransferase
MPGSSARRAALACVAAALLLLAPACRGGSHEEEAPPTRAQDMARDTGEKPQQVMDELGIGAGSKVADVMAGGGYYTFLLSERVGPGGMVYATGAQAVSKRIEEGDLRGRMNVKVVDDLKGVPAGTLDAVVINRAYHLINKPQDSFFPELQRALKPGGKVAVIEVRLGQPTGHDMKTHRMGEQTVRDELEGGGFTLVKSSELLANPGDPRTDFMEGKRHEADRMFLIFEKPAGTTAAR